MANRDIYTVKQDPFNQAQPPLAELGYRYATKLACTFADSRNAPIHRWYPMVVGFSHASIIAAIEENGLTEKDLVLDPFVGCGTTVVVAKSLGIPSMGAEAHPLLSFVSRVKTTWQLHDKRSTVRGFVDRICKLAETVDCDSEACSAPAFLHKLFPERATLAGLYALRKAILRIAKDDDRIRDFLLLGFIGAGKDATRSKRDGIYIAPETKSASALPPIAAFRKRIGMMLSDLSLTGPAESACPATIWEGDARALTTLEPNSVSLVFTSPPYLNNFDYAEMTRLELYLMGMASSWAEITEKVRSKLLINATTQVSRTKFGDLRPQAKIPENTREEICNISSELARKRKDKRGAKSYDITVVAYFNDMADALSEMLRVLKPGRKCTMTVGDSGLYGVHVPTDRILRDIGLGLGFSRARIDILRDRGYRWKLSRRERLPLRESQITLWKS